MTATLGSDRTLDVPQMPQGQLHLEPPPELEPHEGASGALMMALPMLGSVGAIVFVAAGQGGPTRYIAAAMFLVATLGFVFVQVDRQRKQRSSKVAGGRREYLRYLAGVRAQVREAADQQRRSLAWRFPEPTALPALAEERSRLWERGKDDEEFLQVRFGVTSQALALELVAPESAPIDQLDPVSASALHRLIAVHRVQPDLPAALRLGAFSRVELTGEAEQSRALARALVTSATAAHAPQDLLVAVLASQDNLAAWDWVKWLPHAHSPEQNDALGRSRMVSDSLEDVFSMLPPELRDRPRFTGEGQEARPHLLLVVDGGALPPGNSLLPEEGLEGITVLDLPASWGDLEDPSRLRLHLEPAALPDGRVPLTALRLREAPTKAAGDQMALATAEAFARRLAPLEMQDGPVREDPSAATPELLDLLGLGDVHDLDLTKAWSKRPARDRLRVPIGTGEAGSPIHLDIKESAQQGMGPHGLVIGATGSGKSEFLRTLVLGLLATHSSETLNMVLVDFKGGATFAGLADAPHVSAVITNLEGELTLVDRMQDALSGEMVRRQELLRAAGNYASVRDYEKARAEGADLEPLPSLFICVDEFSEMLSAKPDFIELFVAIGRLGRSLGLHLLLASQRLEEGRLRGLESHLSYRVGLRTFSGAESRAVLGVPDAYELPPVPGLGYLKPDQSTLLRFKASYVSGPPPRRSRRGRAAGSTTTTILPFTTAHVLPPRVDSDEHQEVAPVAAAPADSRSVLDIAVDLMVGQGPEAHQVWLPPLELPDSLDQLMGDLAETPEHGLHSPGWRSRGGLVVPLGIVDRPREQRRDVLEADLSGAGGHVAVVGGPRSGKSTLLRTIVASVALTTTPQESQFYVLDFGGGTFAPMVASPHVAGVATRSEPDVVRRTFAEVTGIVDRREKYFRSQGIDSIETYRQRRAAGTADDGYGDVFLVVDGWGTLRSDFDDLEMQIQVLAQRGLTFGLHVITAASRWADYRAAIRDLFGNRFELRLGDPLDSEIDRKVAQLVPSGRPGRGIVQRWGSKLHFLAALPRVDDSSDPRTVGQGVEDFVERSRKAWTGPQGPKLRLLPERVDLTDVLAQAERRHGLTDGLVYLAIDERDLAPVGLDVDREPHLLVFGDSRSGKSALLRTYLREVMRTRTTAQAQVFTVDYRRSLLGEVPEDYQVEYLTNASQADPVIKELAAYLQTRLPGGDVTPQQLRDRSWWTGAEVFVVVDDYDLVVTGSSSPLAPLVPLLGQARDVGLHLVVARRSGGAARAMYEPVIQSLRELAMPGLLLSGDPQEGQLVGTTKPRKSVAGRGQLVTRDRGVDVVQVAWRDPEL
ncbi:DNA segregation ATPase FtsK/SpoIIIE, S-DNA-T family [Nocardioides scoriae]|uniref:DNA segregation ATPase FtsK/SpoIIIE, S-DNA-T family n=1 Tax=Nocardioides scoriae TaxID=642780 RepID=A0A1H1WMZ8_9ACTN|nr:type VII secretion protein EccCa [Nocardioides scoriae]SDS98392.1 DNA segregation ATPase FtsK/SpoIIIE, S-DNA-T family [Nocardioides scoriae]